MKTMKTLKNLLEQLHKDESGQDLIEYALVMLAVVLAAVAGSTTLGSLISNSLTLLSTKINAAIS